MLHEKIQCCLGMFLKVENDIICRYPVIFMHDMAYCLCTFLIYYTYSLLHMNSSIIWISSSLYLYILFMLYFFLYALYGPKIGNK